jgi:DNA (cytosine-5)-methyltransferase 1
MSFRSCWSEGPTVATCMERFEHEACARGSPANGAAMRLPSSAPPTIDSVPLTSIEICAGAGGAALGLERAGFEHVALVENDDACVETLKSIRRWRPHVMAVNVKHFTAREFAGKVDLFSGGVPCPPFSRAGKQLGGGDERDLFPTAIRLIKECRPRAVLLENVRGLLHPRFDEYRERVVAQPLRRVGYRTFGWRVVEARNFGVPQLRPRAVFVAMTRDDAAGFSWPSEEDHVAPPTVGKALRREMARGGWAGAREWALQANGIAPTLVGGSKKHGGPDLGPTQAREQWTRLGVNGKLVAVDPPPPTWNGDSPILTVRMAAILQGFPPDWPFSGRKTAAYRQVGNAFPPPVAEAIGRKIAAALTASRILT